MTLILDVRPLSSETVEPRAVWLNVPLVCLILANDLMILSLDSVLILALD